ncbi:MAG: type II toxin-antitoxin system RelE/ParE family toxin [Anaerolineales bacterium]|nr:type II toxin-antitoxin system RelE/ParE family toxin [Anaerolineales bacterium]
MPNRLIYVAMTGQRFVVLHAFKKKSQKTPSKEIKIAEKRYELLLEREK